MKKARLAKQLSQTELAEKAGVDQTLISHFECVERLPSLPNLKRIADALEVSVDFLLGRESKIGIISDTEKNVIEGFRLLCDRDKQIVISLVNNMIYKKE